MNRFLVGVLASLAPVIAFASSFECLIEPWQVVDIRSPADGVIASIPVSRGQVIQLGQTLVTLRSEVETESVNSARHRLSREGQMASVQNRLSYASKKAERAEKLVAQNFVSAQALDEAQTEKQMAESELKSALEAREMARIEFRRASELLALRTIKAPFAGVVIDRMLNPGDLAESGSGRKPVLKVAQINPARTDIALPASLFGQVRVGSSAVVVASIGGKPFSAVVRSVDRTIDAASDTFVARLEIANATLDVPVGSRCKATLEGVKQVPRPAAIRGAAN